MRIFLEAEVKVRVILVNNFVVKGLKVYAVSFIFWLKCFFVLSANKHLFFVLNFEHILFCVHMRPVLACPSLPLLLSWSLQFSGVFS